MTAEVVGLLARVGSTPDNSIAGRAQSRGKIERLQQSLWKRSARKLPTYNGRDMDNEARRRVVKLIGKDIKEAGRSEEHTSELQSLMRISYAVFCLKKKKKKKRLSKSPTKHDTM